MVDQKPINYGDMEVHKLIEAVANALEGGDCINVQGICPHSKHPGSESAGFAKLIRHKGATHI